MTILGALKRVRDDIRTWCTNNFNMKLNKNLGSVNSGKFLFTDTNGEIIPKAITATAQDDDVIVLNGASEGNEITYTATHAASGVTPGTYKSVTVNSQGHITAGTNPTTLAGYGITDAVTQTALNALSQTVDTKANKSDVARTVSVGISQNSTTYAKISDFGSWGDGVWYQKGFSMLITSRAGELVWVSVSSDDSNTNAKAIRLLNTYTKITNLYYSVSESAIYVKAYAWCNNISAQIISNINGDYVPTVTHVSNLASDAVEINIVEFGATREGLAVGDMSTPLILGGSAARPTYNSSNVALLSDVPTTPTDIGAAAVAHSQAASTISAGTFAGQVKANASAVQTIETAQLRNIYAGSSDIGVGASLATGDIYFVYE